MSDEKLIFPPLDERLGKGIFPRLHARKSFPPWTSPCCGRTPRCAKVTEAAREVEAVGAASVCVASCNVAVAKSVTPRVCSVIGFPHGNMSPDVKFAEARAAVEDGAIELDVVINYGRLLEGRSVAVTEELRRIIQYTMQRQVRVKAILETCYYSPQQITDACKLCMDIGVDWVKSSTGFFGGATPEAVLTMLAAVKGGAQVKASGGITDL